MKTKTRIIALSIVMLTIGVKASPQTWLQLGTDIDGKSSSDWFGHSVSMNDEGTRLAVGAPFDAAGYFSVYEYSGGIWTQLGTDIYGEVGGDRFGQSISMSADGIRVAVGAVQNDGSGDSAGHVRVFEYSGGTWTQLGADIDAEAAYDQSGNSVSLNTDGSRVAIGAARNAANGVYSGHVRVFEYAGGSWVQLGADIDGEAGDRVGESVSLSADGTRVAVGAPNDGVASDSGYVQIFEYAGSSWVQLGADIIGEAGGDRFGVYVSLSANGTRVAAGAERNDGNGDNAGHARVFEYISGDWVQLGADINGEAAGDSCGEVCLSANGMRLAVGAQGNDGNGDVAGHARIYKYSGNDWIQLGADIEGEAAGDLLPNSIAMSATGSRVALGAAYNDGNGASSGHVRVFGNTDPTVQIVSATMRPGTALMDVVYRVDDADDATVKVRALAFVDGVRSFANVIRPETWAEGTDANLGDAIATGIDHALTWDIGADWDIDLGQLKFEVLCRDDRGLLEFDWITIPAADGNPELTISKNSPTDADVLDALFWQYADSDPALTLADGVLSANTNSGVFAAVELAAGATIKGYATPYLLKQMDLAVATRTAYAVYTARAPLDSYSPKKWYAESRPYDGIDIILGWGYDDYGQATPPAGLSDVTALAAGSSHSLALKADGTVVGWGLDDDGQATPPAGMTGVTAIAAGGYHSLALKADGTVVGWGRDNHGQATPPVGLSDVTAIAAGENHSLALKADGTVVGWGYDNSGQATPPVGLSEVTAIAAGGSHSLALKADGTVVGWGSNGNGRATPPAGLSEVTAIAAGDEHSLALKADGTVVGWGLDDDGQATPPAGLSDVTAIAAGGYHSLALKADGTVVGWGHDGYGEATPPAGLTGVTAIAAAGDHCLALKAKAE